MNLQLRFPGEYDEDTWSAILKTIGWVDHHISHVHRVDSEPQVVRFEYSGTEAPAGILTTIERTTADIAKLHTRVAKRIYFCHGESRRLWGTNPVTQLIRDGTLKPVNGAIEASGMFLQLMRGIDRLIVQFARTLRATEYDFPLTLPLAHAKRCGILDNYPHHAYFAGNVRYGVETIRRLRSAAPAELERLDWNATLNSPSEILAPAVCYHFWSQLPERWDKARDLNVGTAVGRCFRFELPEPAALHRLREFRMREIFAVGLTERIRTFRIRALTYLQELLPDLGLCGQLETAFDPFFVDQYAAKRLLQLGSELKCELQVWHPYQGQTIAVASANDHRDFFGRTCGLPDRDHARIDSFCLAFGLERFAMAIVEQHGADHHQWPGELQRLLA
jgi:seryl-tRNA synthetase